MQSDLEIRAEGNCFETSQQLVLSVFLSESLGIFNLCAVMPCENCSVQHSLIASQV